MRSIFFILSAIILQSVWALEFDRSLPLEQRQIIQSDLENLCRLNYDSQSEGARKAKKTLQGIFEMEEVNCQELKNWLFDRVKWITGGFDFQERIIIQRDESSLLNFLAWRYFYFSQGRIIETVDEYAYAMNVGGFLFEILQRVETNKWFFPFRFGEFQTWFKFIRDDAREIWLPITTPRVGIVRLSPRLFDGEEDSLAGSIFRISTLFHEARHSDGHGEHSTFPHNISCPNSSLPVGCDSVLNGAYGVQFTFLHYAIQTCDSCSEREKEVLAQHAVTDFDKIDTKSKKLVDASPIEIPPLQPLP